MDEHLFSVHFFMFYFTGILHPITRNISILRSGWWHFNLEEECVFPVSNLKAVTGKKGKKQEHDAAIKQSRLSHG